MRSEANIFRYRTTLEPVVIYIGEHHALRDVYRQLLAAAVTGTEVRVVAPAAVFDGPALIDGRRELLPYLLEQSVSATLHRFGVIHDPAGIRG